MLGWRVTIYFTFDLINVKNFMSCHSFALTRCHKLIHLFVTASGAFAPDFLLYSTDHFMVSYKPHHMLIYQPFLLLIRVHQCLLTDSVDHPRYACGYLEDFIFGSTGEQILFHSCIEGIRIPDRWYLLHWLLKISFSSLRSNRYFDTITMVAIPP